MSKENRMENVLEMEPETEVFIEPDSLKMALEFSKRYTRLLMDRKNTNEDIKSLKKEFNEQGLPTNIVVKAFNELRNEKKAKNKDEVQCFKQCLEKNSELLSLLKELESDQ